MFKRFSPRELILRIRAVLRRAEGAPERAATVIRHDELAIDTEKHCVSIRDATLELTVTEFNLLLELVRGKGRAWTRDQLLDRVWGYRFEGYHRTVDTHIRRLRQKLGPLADNIETVRGIGYRFRE